MTILWCGGEDIDFPNGTLPSMEDGSSFRRSVYARGSIYCGSHAWSKSVAEFTSGWLSFQSYCGSGYLVYMIGAVVDDGDSGLWIGKDISDHIILAKRESSGWTTIATSASTTCTGLRRFDVQFSWGASVNVKVYMDENLEIDYTGDTTISGSTGYSRVGFCGGSASYKSTTSEIILADEDTRLMSLKSLVPNAAGDANAWTGTYADVDELWLSDADVLNVDINNAEVQMNLTGMPAGSFDVRAVKLSARTTKTSDSTPTKVALGVKTDGTIDNDSGHSITDEIFDTCERLMVINPVTGSAFTSDEVEVLQINFKSLA